MEKYGFVYIWKEQSLNKFYIGSHWGNENDSYICSSRSMRQQYKRQPQNFKRRIVARIITNRTDLLQEEQRWLDMIKPEEFGRKYYNINGKANRAYWWMNEETIKIVTQKIQNAPGRIDKIKIKRTQQVFTDEHKKRMSKSHKGQIPVTAWKKGNVPWNQGLHGVMPTPWNKGKIGLPHKHNLLSNQVGRGPYQKRYK